MRSIFLPLFVAFWMAASVRGAAGDDSSSAYFDRVIAPLFAARCLHCHNSSTQEAGLDLSRKDAAQAGGESGAVLVAGKPEQSLLWEFVSTEHMPPEKPLTAAEKQALKKWITEGAAWGVDPIDAMRYTTDSRAGYDWWAWRPLKRPQPPPLSAGPVGDAAWGDNAIDLFVLARLSSRKIAPSPPADRLTLLRRLCFDLLGLPPTPSQIDEFLADRAPGAYARLVDRLLASPHYGERWARHWLDIVRFGESQGFERDKLRPGAWPYRDWVVQSLNQDMAYDQFAHLQLAGDILSPHDAGAIAATGFLVAGAYDEVGQSQQSAAMKAAVRQDELEDLVSAVGQTFLGLTIHCARCHDHKFDPVRQREYYQLAAALAGVRHGMHEAPGPLTYGAASPAGRYEARIASLRRRRDTLPADQRKPLDFEIAQLKSLIKRARSKHVYAALVRPAEPIHVLHRGNPAKKGERVYAGGVAAVARAADFGRRPGPQSAASDDDRIRLARWITDSRNGLFSRAVVNRLWHYHFGAGLVPTPSDLGFNGGRPSHPRLLDWLACELARQNYRLKPLHRLIVTSAVYRQSSRLRPAAVAKDAMARLLWRKVPRRLEAEAVRDAILAAAGELDPTLGGPGYYDFHTFVNNTQFYQMLDPIGVTFQRRSLYRTWARSGRSRFLDVFDCPDPSAKAPRRAVTVTPIQALALLNDSLVLRMADRMADRLKRQAGPQPSKQIELAYRLAFGRPVQADERRLTEPFVRRHGLSAFCRVLFNSNEFLYVD